MDKIVKTDAGGRMLTDEQFYVTRQAGTERAFSGNIGSIKRKVFMHVCAVENYFVRMLNLILVVVGQVILSPLLKKRLQNGEIFHTE